MLSIGVAMLLAQRVDAQVSDLVLPTGARVRPAGKTVTIPARPVDAVFAPDGSRLFVKDSSGLRVLSATDGQELGKLNSPGGTSLTGIAVGGDGKTVFLTSADTKLHLIDVSADTPKVSKTIDLPGPGGKGNSFPCGVAVSADGATAYVCLSINNSLGVVDVASGKLTKEIPVGIAPYAVCLSQDGARATVSLLGGPLEKTRSMANSAGTMTPTDHRGVAATGGIASVDLSAAKLLSVVKVGRQAADMDFDGQRVYVANSNDDLITVFDPEKGAKVTSTLVRPDARLPFGSMPSAIAHRGNRLYVALAGNNAVAVLDAKSLRPKGYIPTGWYPTAIAVNGDQLAITSLKGLGSRTKRGDAQNGRNSYDYTSTVQFLTDPTDTELKSMSDQVREDLYAPQILKAFERARKGKAKPTPVPAQLGQPSVFEHVVYVIKENRTYDQVFGDIPMGERDPNLCTFPEKITPNHHAIAREYALLDNYYCNGVLSADGHSWATEGNVTPYLERAFGGFNRSYTFGDDPLTYSSSGFLWDRVLDAGLSFRNFGEMDYATPPEGMGIKELLKNRGGVYPAFKHNIGVDRLRRFSDPQYPGWNMEIPDIVRMDRFREEFKRFEKEGVMPSLTVVYLPQDHGGSSVTARANVADNDLAVGQLIETLSHSKFWAKTVVFINEDDPQGGYDHVDGHRSICLVVSPYTRKRGLVSDFYNQTSVIHTMLQILGLPPLNQRDASSALMTKCFGAKLDLTPYTARPNRIPLDETKVPNESAELTAFAKKVKARMAKFVGEVGRTPADDDLMNRYLWHEAKGMGTPYPAHLAGSHGRGLRKRGLKLAAGQKVDDDDD